MTGKVGRLGSALLPLRGQNRVQGSSDMGALPDTFTAYRSVGDDTVARSLEEAWGVKHVFTTFHFPETRTNLLIGSSADVNTSCPSTR